MTNVEVREKEERREGFFFIERKYGVIKLQEEENTKELREEDVNEI